MISMVWSNLWVRTFLYLGLALGSLGAAFLFSGPRQAVDWRPIRAVALESDDWGLPGFSPDRQAWLGVDRQLLEPGTFPEPYWNSTLEDSTMVADLCAIMAINQGADGLPAVFQPNYVMGSHQWVTDAGDSGHGHWVEISLPEFPARYQRPGLWPAVFAGINEGLWYPELHARWHYDPAMRFENAFANETARVVTERGITLFPGSEKARELGPWREKEDLERELTESKAIFYQVFGRTPDSIIAPDYTWNGDMEDIWASQDIRILQAKREQRNPEWGYGVAGRVRKLIQRKYDQLRHPDLKYLERNCRLEPVQDANPQGVVDRCVADTHKAWKIGQPAIVETHRVNLAHLEPEVLETGQKSLANYLTQITQDVKKDHLPIFLTDVEIAMLGKRGVSWVRRGQKLILRNRSHASRILAVEPYILPHWHPGHGKKQTQFLRVSPQTTLVLSDDGQNYSCSFER